jgi:transcriptional regulator with XRE-family HTH domain
MRTQVKSKDYQDFIDDLSGYYGEPDGGEEKLQMGERLKKLREIQSLSTDKLAKLTGVTEKYLKDVESGKVFPDLGTVIKLAKALRISTGVLLDDASGYTYSVVREKDRKKIRRVPSGTQEKPNYLYQSLSEGVKRRHMESFIVTLPEGVKAGEPSSHEGEEFILVLEGKVLVSLGGKEETLGVGDSIYYHSAVPHTLTSADKKQAVIMAVVYTG